MVAFKLLLVLACVFLVRCSNVTVEKCMRELEEIKERLGKLETSKSLSRRLLLPPDSSAHSKVAFYTQLSKDIGHLGNHQTIVFDTITTNIGDGYNEVDGIFTAPVTGTYVFFWLNTNRDHHFMNTELVKNAVVIGKSMSDSMNHIDYTAASNTAVVQLQKGEEVWVRSRTWHSAVVTGDFYFTFSGWLLYEG